jgi:hypothetical protein
MALRVNMARAIHSVIVKSDQSEFIKMKLADMREHYVKAGFPENAAVGRQNSRRVAVFEGKGANRRKIATYAKTKGTAGKAYENMSEVARVAVWNEFGVPEKNIPSRPFFRTAYDGNRRAIGDFVVAVSKRVLFDKLGVAQGLELIGLKMQALIRSSIRATTSPPNRPRTIKAKHSSHPLIDTGQMINSVTFVAVRGSV